MCIKRLAIGEIILYYEEPTLKAEISDKIPIGTYIYRPIPTYAIENLREEIVKEIMEYFHASFPKIELK